MPRPRPALEAPPLSTSNEKKGSKDAVDTKNPSRRSKKTGTSAALSYRQNCILIELFRHSLIMKFGFLPCSNY